MRNNYFEYGDKETSFLSGKDSRLGEVIARVGHIEREVIPDLFAALVNSIVGQQISAKAHATVWQRFVENVGEVSPAAVLSIADESWRNFGIPLRKEGYIKEAARRFGSGEFNEASLLAMSDEELLHRLVQLHGVGVWTAEMLMIFSLQRPDIFSFGDSAIQRGLRMVYHHRKITNTLFERYRRRFSPYCSVASLYLWAVAGGALPEMRDYASGKK